MALGEACSVCICILGAYIVQLMLQTVIHNSYTTHYTAGEHVFMPCFAEDFSMFFHMQSKGVIH